MTGKLLPAVLASLVAVLLHGSGPAGPQAGQEEKATRPGELRTHATMQCIGIEWDISGDANHNAVCKVACRVQGTEAWKEALPLFRIDFHGWYAKTKADRRYNMFAGSILFLQPGTTYEVKLDVADPDGGAETKTFTIPTRPLPRIPENGRRLHVVPGQGGGDGSKDKPFQGLAAAQTAARPGDVFLLQSGNYGHFTFDQPGQPGRYIVWKRAGAGPAVFHSAEVAASHLWLEGLTFQKGDKTTAFRAGGAPADVVLSRSSFTGFHNSIVLNRASRDWYIADNEVVGDNDPAKHSAVGEGIDLYQSSGHVVAHNRVSRVQTGVHYPRSNCDIYGNDIFDTTDDGLEPDYGYANIRMWQNRITNFGANGLSFQPQYCGPWYYLRNQVIGAGYIFKFRVQDRFVLVNNTFVNWTISSDRMYHLLTSLSRNNLYISATTRRQGPLWVCNRYKDETPEFVRPLDLKPNWMTDVDYDGFDWGDAPVPFSWNGSHKDLKSFAEAVGIEKHGVRVRKEEIFEKWNIPEQPGRVEPVSLTLKQGSNAIDAGAVLPGINDDFAGKAPDLGAHEHGKPLPVYGPRELPGPLGLVQTDVFVSGKEGYHTFRIPSTILTPKGTVLAFCEGRKTSRSDTGDIDLVLKRSLDGGKTWGPLQIVADDGPNTMGNPCPVIDRKTGTIWLLLTRNLGEDKQSQIVDGTSKGTREAWLTKSTDDGATWSKPVEITRSVKDPKWTWYATGPGYGIQLKTGRLVIPCDHSPPGPRVEHSHVIYSDDAGATWKLGGKTDVGCGESQVVELADGTLLINMRNEGGGKQRRIATSKDAGLSWSRVTDDANLIEPVCQASLFRLPPTENDPKDRLLFSNPASNKREKMTVRLSYDEGKSWPAARQLHAGPSAYSCLTALPDRSIGCLYENGDKSAYEKITFARFPIDWLTEGRDALGK